MSDVTEASDEILPERAAIFDGVCRDRFYLVVKAHHLQRDNDRNKGNAIAVEAPC